MKRTIFLFLNTVTFLFTLVANYLINSQSHGPTVADISEKYSSLFTPADYAFAIWGLIYLQLISFLAYHWAVRNKETMVIEKTGYWFAISNVANGFWILAWVHEYTGLSVLIMLVLLYSLIQLVLAHRLEIWDAPVRIIFFIWWPVCVYLGWIVLATVANISAWLVSLGWQGAPLSESLWTCILIVISMVIYLLLIRKRNMREASMIGIWGLVAIAIRHWEEIGMIFYTSLIASLILLIATATHGLKNVNTSPFIKWKRGEI